MHDHLLHYSLERDRRVQENCNKQFEGMLGSVSNDVETPEAVANRVMPMPEWAGQHPLTGAPVCGGLTVVGRRYLDELGIVPGQIEKENIDLRLKVFCMVAVEAPGGKCRAHTPKKKRKISESSSQTVDGGRYSQFMSEANYEQYTENEEIGVTIADKLALIDTFIQRVLLEIESNPLLELVFVMNTEYDALVNAIESKDSDLINRAIRRIGIARQKNVARQASIDTLLKQVQIYAKVAETHLKQEQMKINMLSPVQARQLILALAQAITRNVNDADILRRIQADFESLVGKGVIDETLGIRRDSGESRADLSSGPEDSNEDKELGEFYAELGPGEVFGDTGTDGRAVFSEDEEGNYPEG